MIPKHNSQNVGGSDEHNKDIKMCNYNNKKPVLSCANKRSTLLFSIFSIAFNHLIASCNSQIVFCNKKFLFQFHIMAGCK